MMDVVLAAPIISRKSRFVNAFVDSCPPQQKGRAFFVAGSGWFAVLRLLPEDYSPDEGDARQVGDKAGDD